MTSRLLVLAAGLAAVVVVVLGVVAVGSEEWVLAACAAGVLALGMFGLQLDTWRRTRAGRSQLRSELARQAKALSAPPALPPVVPETTRRAVGDDDLRGALTMLQTQQAARLDRLQTALDLALAELADRRSDTVR